MRDLGCNVHRLENSGVWSLECLGIRVLTVSLLVVVVDCSAAAGLMAACPGRAGTARGAMFRCVRTPAIFGNRPRRGTGIQCASVS